MTNPGVPAPRPGGGLPASQSGADWQPPSAWQPPADWAAPAEGSAAPGLAAPSPRRRRIPTAVLGLLIGTATLALVIATVFAAGGFERRNSLQPAEIGQPLDLGPVRVTLHHAQASSSGVHVAASCEVTDTTADPSTSYAVADAAFAAARVNDLPTDSESTMLTLGIDAERDLYTTTRDTLSPGLQPMPCLFKFTFPDGQFGDKLVVGLLRLQFVDLSNVRNENTESRSWESSSDGYVLELPLSGVR